MLDHQYFLNVLRRCLHVVVVLSVLLLFKKELITPLIRIFSSPSSAQKPISITKYTIATLLVLILALTPVVYLPKHRQTTSAAKRYDGAVINNSSSYNKLRLFRRIHVTGVLFVLMLLLLEVLLDLLVLLVSVRKSRAMSVP